MSGVEKSMIMTSLHQEGKNLGSVEDLLNRGAGANQLGIEADQTGCKRNQEVTAVNGDK